MLEKVRQRMRTAIMMTIPVAVLPKTLKRVPVEAVIQELQVAAPVAEVNLAEAALVAENLPVVKVQNNV